MYQVRRILPIIFRNTSASCSLINPNFLQSHIAHFYESIALPFLPFQVLGFCFLYFSTYQIMRYCRFINRLKSSMNRMFRETLGMSAKSGGRIQSLYF